MLNLSNMQKQLNKKKFRQNKRFVFNICILHVKINKYQNYIKYKNFQKYV